MRLPLRSLALRPVSTRLFGIEALRPLSLRWRDYGKKDGSHPAAYIDALLQAHGVDDANGELWLQTFPRVFNYVFNPVSMWFCERADGGLRAVVCEVNNTFGESHCYLLCHDDGALLRDGEPVVAKKVFHVSPFCRIEGQYAFRFVNTAERSVARIDYDDQDGPLIYTSISGSLAPLTDRSLIKAMLAYPLFTFAVVLRIHWQALRLWGKRLPFFTKPEPPAVEVSR